MHASLTTTTTTLSSTACANATNAANDEAAVVLSWFEAQTSTVHADSLTPPDDYVLGGYAGI